MKNKEDNHFIRLIGALETSNQYFRESIQEIKAENKETRKAIESIVETLSQLATLHVKFQNYEALSLRLQNRLDTNYQHIGELQLSVDDISERLESSKELRRKLLYAVISVIAGLLVLAANITWAIEKNYFGI